MICRFRKSYKKSLANYQAFLFLFSCKILAFDITFICRVININIPGALPDAIFIKIIHLAYVSIFTRFYFTFWLKKYNSVINFHIFVLNRYSGYLFNCLSRGRRLNLLALFFTKSTISMPM